MSYDYLSAENIFTAIIDQDGNVYKMNGHRKGVLIGIDSEKEKEYQTQIAELVETLEAWRPKMIEHGYIKEVKSPEEIAAESAAEQVKIMQEQTQKQNEINQALLEAIKDIKSEISELRGNQYGFDGFSNEGGGEPVGQDSQSFRKKSAGSKVGNKSGEKITA